MRKKIVPILLLLTGLLSFGTLYAKLPKEERVPGGVALVPLEIKDTEPPKVSLKGRQVAVVKNPSKSAAKENPWIAIVGIPIKQLPGIVELTIEGKTTTQQVFNITQQHYPTEYLTIKPTAPSTKPPTEADRLAEEKLAQRLAEERKILHAAYQSWDATQPATFQLAWPLKGRISGLYGARRVINDKPRQPHTGLDIAAPKGTPVKSSGKGKVINTGNYFFTGKTVVVDHGLGFKTIYCHLDQIKAKEGDQLKKGQILGTVGKTGRATGPHLHFGVSLNDQRVSPQLFLPDR